MAQKPKYRIGIVAIVVLVAIAFIADLIGLIPLAKDITASVFWIGAGIYFWIKGMGIFNGKKLAAVAISWIASLIPVIQELPIEVTAGIIAVILITRVEDKTGVSVLKPLSEGKQIASARTMLNHNGRREPIPRQQLNEKDGVREPEKGAELAPQ